MWKLLGDSAAGEDAFFGGGGDPLGFDGDAVAGEESADTGRGVAKTEEELKAILAFEPVFEVVEHDESRADEDKVDGDTGEGIPGGIGFATWHSQTPSAGWMPRSSSNRKSQSCVWALSYCGRMVFRWAE